MLTVGFLSNQLCVRGTDTAMFDYADQNERLLGNRSVILVDGNTDPARNDAARKFVARFGGYHAPRSRDAMEGMVRELGIDVLYKTCAGSPEVFPRNVKTGIHVVFGHYEPFGQVYAYISEWLRDAVVPAAARRSHDYVPYMVRLPDETGDLRPELGLSAEQVVFGYHGGSDSFNIPFVRDAIADALRSRSDVAFVFLNIPAWIRHPRVHFLPGTADPIRKTCFINSCDAMLHARDRGETFGLAIAEFSIRNRPVLTYRHSPEQCHLRLLGPKAITYGSRAELAAILSRFRPARGIDWDCYSQRFSPAAVMERFRRVFLS